MALNDRKARGAAAAELDPRETEQVPRSEQTVEEQPRRTRRSTLNNVGLATDIPERFKKPGWAYAWWPMTVMNEPVEPWVQSAVEDGGWEPVRTNEMPGFMPSSYAHATIQAYGQMLYSRPQYLEDESREEDIIRARRQSEGRLESARIEDPRAPHTYGMKTPDETFVRRGDRAADINSMEADVMAQRESARRSRSAQDPLSGSLRTSADDISPEERAQIAEDHRRGRSRFGQG